MLCKVTRAVQDLGERKSCRLPDYLLDLGVLGQTARMGYGVVLWDFNTMIHAVSRFFSRLVTEDTDKMASDLPRRRRYPDTVQMHNAS